MRFRLMHIPEWRLLMNLFSANITILCICSRLLTEIPTDFSAVVRLNLHREANRVILLYVKKALSPCRAYTPNRILHASWTIYRLRCRIKKNGRDYGWEN